MRASLRSLTVALSTWLLSAAARLQGLGRLTDRMWRRPPAAPEPAGPDGHYAGLIAEHASDLIALLDERGRYRYVSSSHARILGFASAEMVGERCVGFIHPDDQPLARARWQEARASGSAALVRRVARRDGGWCWVDARIERPSHQGEPLMLLVARDVTEQQELDQRLLLAQRTLTIGTLASSIVHDINNVLTAIEGSATLAASALHSDDPAQADLATILAAGRHCGDLTRRLLSFVRQQPASLAPTDLGVLTLELLPLVGRLCARHVQVQADIEPGLWPILAERSRLEQVLINLAINACDAMPDGGRLLVRAANKGEAWVQLEVVDNGVGMSDEVLARAFEPFYTTKAPSYGSGLGLFTSRYIIGELQGSITATSAPGAGTTFTILLPRYRGEGVSAMPSYE